MRTDITKDSSKKDSFWTAEHVLVIALVVIIPIVAYVLLNVPSFTSTAISKESARIKDFKEAYGVEQILMSRPDTITLVVQGKRLTCDQLSNKQIEARVPMKCSDGTVLTPSAK
jgi:hypothetical protein